MEWLFLSITILLVASGMVYYVHRAHERWMVRRLLQEKQLAVYEEIACLMGAIKATMDYTTGEETLRQWKTALMDPLHEMLRKSYEWSVFLPDDLKDQPSQYAGQVVQSLARLDTTDEVESYAEMITTVKRIEEKAAQELRGSIRAAMLAD